MWTWFGTNLFVLNTTIKKSIRTSLLIVSHLHERDQISPIEIFSFVLCFFLWLQIYQKPWFFVFWFGIREQYMVLCDMHPMSPVLINKNVWGPRVSWPTFYCHVPHVLKLNINLDQVFLRVPTGAPQMFPFWVCRPVHKSMPLLSPCLLVQHAVLVSASTTLSPANCGCYPGGPRNGFHCTPPCQGWHPLSLCATTPKLQEPPVLITLISCGRLWQDVAGEHPSFSLVLHFGREAPEWGYLAPDTNRFPGLQENVAFCSV